MDRIVLNIWPDDINEEEGWITTGFVIETAGKPSERIWYKLPLEHRSALTQSCDPYVIAVIFKAMKAKADIHVHGMVSPSLLDNLEEFQLIWHKWLPEMYTPVSIRADDERELPASPGSASVMAFSGGLDSCFSAYQHRKGLAGRGILDLKAGLMLLGFDIPLRSQAAYHRALGRSTALLSSLGMETIPMVINFKILDDDLDFTFATQLASCLSLLQGRFANGVIANSDPNNNLVQSWALPYGSNSISDPFLSSLAFPIIHDGASFTRFQKSRILASWPEAMQNMRVCLGRNPDQRDRNCCRCEKCLRNILTFRALGLGLPACFEHDPTNLEIARMNFPSTIRIFYYKHILYETKQTGLHGSWINALRLTIALNQIKSAVRQLAVLLKIKKPWSRR